MSELVAVRLVRELADMTGAGYASLVMNRTRGARCLVSLGSPGQPLPRGDREGDRRQFAAAGFECTMPLGEAASATLTLSPPPGGHFGREAALIADAATDVIQVWLAGAHERFQDAAADAAESTGFGLRPQD